MKYKRIYGELNSYKGWERTKTNIDFYYKGLKISRRVIRYENNSLYKWFIAKIKEADKWNYENRKIYREIAVEKYCLLEKTGEKVYNCLGVYMTFNEAEHDYFNLVNIYWEEAN